MNVNPIQLIQMIKSGKNPEQLVMNVLQQQANNNPILQNAATLARKGNMSALEMLARNLTQQRGMDFDTEFANFKNNYLR